MIIGISGKINSGKDTVGKIIQYLTSDIFKHGREIYDFIEDSKNNEFTTYDGCSWQIKKFADKLKDIVCILIGCTRKQLENHKFKETPLRDEWSKYLLEETFEYLISDNCDEHKTYFSTEIEAEDRANNIKNKYKSDKSIKYNYDITKIKLTPRLLLQLLGTECGRQIIHPNIWINSLFSDYKPTTNNLNSLYPNWIITDVRFKNELEAIKNKNSITIKVIRPCKECGLSRNHKPDCNIGISEHLSEKDLDNAKFDFVINNNRTIDDLIINVKEILRLCGMI
jgi:hypothetical protein